MTEDVLLAAFWRVAQRERLKRIETLRNMSALIVDRPSGWDPATIACHQERLTVKRGSES